MQIERPQLARVNTKYKIVQAMHMNDKMHALFLNKKDQVSCHMIQIFFSAIICIVLVQYCYQSKQHYNFSFALSTFQVYKSIRIMALLLSLQLTAHACINKKSSQVAYMIITSTEQLIMKCIQLASKYYNERLLDDQYFAQVSFLTKKTQQDTDVTKSLCTAYMQL